MHSRKALRLLITALEGTTVSQAVRETLDAVKPALGAQEAPTKPQTPRPRHVVIRTTSAGCFAAELVSFDPKTLVAELKNSRRLWYWKGAASLSELALSGVKYPTECKFPGALPTHYVSQVIEIIDMTDAAVASVARVTPWVA